MATDINNNTTTLAGHDFVTPLHPYHPLGVVIPGYLANEMATADILARFVLGCAIVLSATMAVARRVRSRSKGRGEGMATSEAATAMWFVLCGCIHIGMEGYVVYNSATISSSSTLLAQAWKEYSLSDSRYLTQDTFVITMEAVTAIFWGPLSFLIAYLIMTEHPLRHPFQIIVSVGQLYGDVLYYATCAYEHFVWGKVFCRPEGWYFWGYFVLLNAFWIVIPLGLVVGSVRKVGEVFARVWEMDHVEGKEKKKVA